jgi:phosphatidylserine/phosphatidylglycerophosphate/cardiolipin synthase-like enzyme
MEGALLDLIDGATSRIDAAVYGLNRQRIVDALIAAHQRGVAVRVVGDDQAAVGAYSDHYGQLAASGVTVITDTSTSKIQHNKFLVFDGQVTWTGSTNLTDTGLTLNANSSMVITDTTLASSYTAEFEEMWGGRFDGDKTINTIQHLEYAGLLVESYFPPTDLPAFEVWLELAKAEETIHFAMFYWTDALLSERVVERLAAGVQVYGVWDQLGAANASSQDEMLCAAGARIGIEDLPGKVHHKFAVLDVEGDDPVVILGSYNWTAGGAYDNDENTLIVHDRALARAYLAEWQRLWESLAADRICEAAAVYLPLVLRDGS